MRVLLRLLAVVSLLDIAYAGHPANVFKRAENYNKRAIVPRDAHRVEQREEHKKFNGPAKSRFLTNKTEEFAVQGIKFPDLDFDPGESYSGLLPITGDKDEKRKYFFWFWPSLNSTGPKEIVIWFNGGPGCSSLAGFLTENGPFMWQDGTPKPVQNTYDWRNLTNVMWVEQPIGVGFTQGKANITNEIDVGKQIVSFYEQFSNVFDTKGFDIYLTGESYAGYYLPYMANEFIKTNSSDMPLKGIHINDPLLGDHMAQQAATVGPFAEYWHNMLGFNDTDMENITAQHETCGYKKFLDEYLTFPPPQKPFPVLDYPNDTNPCDTLSNMVERADQVNPCFNIYRISDTCPELSSALHQINSDYNPTPEKIFFNRTDVQGLLHVPQGWAWDVCSRDPVFPTTNKSSNSTRGSDLSPPPAQNGVLQNVIEKTNHVIIGSGNLDALLNTNGTLLALQNMTWNGYQGFKEYPGKGLFAPYHLDWPGSDSGAGYTGKWGSERGLTFYQVQLAGHMVPGDALATSFRVMELLLGRVENLGIVGNFTTEQGNG